MPYVRFLKTRTVQDGTGTTYMEGKVYAMTRASADRWIRRNCAVEITDAPGYVVPAQPKSDDTERADFTAGVEEGTQEHLDSPQNVAGENGSPDRVGTVVNRRADQPRRRGRPPRNSHQ